VYGRNKENNLTVTNMPESETPSRFHTSKALNVHKRPLLCGLLLHFTFHMQKVRRFSSCFGAVLTIFFAWAVSRETELSVQLFFL